MLHRININLTTNVLHVLKVELISKRFMLTGSGSKIAKEVAKGLENKLPSTSSTTSNISKLSSNSPPSSNIHKPTMYSKTSDSQQTYIEKEHLRGQKLFNSFTETPIIPGRSPSLLKDKHYEASRESEPAMLQRSSQIQDIKPILNEAEEQKLIKYEDTKEYTASGAVKLSAEGFKRFNNVVSNSITASNTSNEVPQTEVTYEIGILIIDSDTAIPLPIQMHLIVVHDQANNTFRGIGILTSEKDPLNIKLSDTQTISGNMNKAQYIRPLHVPLTITREQFISHKKGTEYIQNPELAVILNQVRNKTLKYLATLYNPKGITSSDLTEIIQMKAQEPLAKEKNKSHYEVEKQQMKQEKTKLVKLEQETLKKKKLQDMENTKEIINEKSDT